VVRVKRIRANPYALGAVAISVPQNRQMATECRQAFIMQRRVMRQITALAEWGERS